MTYFSKHLKTSPILFKYYQTLFKPLNRLISLTDLSNTLQSAIISSYQHQILPNNPTNTLCSFPTHVLENALAAQTLTASYLIPDPNGALPEALPDSQLQIEHRDALNR